MSLRKKFWLGFIPVAALGLALVAAGLVFVVGGGSDAADRLPGLLGFLVIGGGLVLLLLLIWVFDFLFATTAARDGYERQGPCCREGAES